MLDLSIEEKEKLKIFAERLSQKQKKKLKELLSRYEEAGQYEKINNM